MANDRDRKYALLHAAAQEFGSKGFAGSRVDTIARRAGVNKQLIFYYFGSKRGLFEASIRRDPATLKMAAEAPSTDQLRSAVRGILDHFDSHPETRSALFDPAADPATTAGVLADLEMPLAAAISHGQGLGYFRDAADPGRVARQAVVLCAGWHAMQNAAGPREAWLDGVLDTIRRSLAW